MTKDTFVASLSAAASDGTLMTPKHDPSSLGTVYTSYRSVLAHEVANDLRTFVLSGNYEVVQYQNLKFPNSPSYYELIPPIDSTYSIPASGVSAYSLSATSALDRLIAVSGQQQGWHLFGESSHTVHTKETDGDLIRIGSL